MSNEMNEYVSINYLKYSNISLFYSFINHSVQQLIVKSFTSVTATAGRGASIPDHDATKPRRQPFPWQRGHCRDKTTKQG